MNKSEWDLLPHTKSALDCYHCGHKTLMKVIVEKSLSETFYFYYAEHGEVPTGDRQTEWKILQCPLCKEINVIEITSTDDDEEDESIVVGMDEYDQPIFPKMPKIKVLYPVADLDIPNPEPNMPPEIAKDFIEAKNIFPFSARSSAALLRLVIQKLCIHLGEKGKDINADIQELVNKGLPQHIQQALDIVRVIGNEAVHPGEINVRDNPEIAKKLFSLVNEIIDDRISKPHKQAEIEKIYQTLPENKLNGILQRSKPK